MSKSDPPSGARPTLHRAERAAQPFQGSRQIRASLRVEIADRRHLIQELKRVPQVLTRRFCVRGVSGVGATLERATTFRPTPAVYLFSQVEGTRRQDASAGADSPVRAATTLCRMASGGHVWPFRRTGPHSR